MAYFLSFPLLFFSHFLCLLIYLIFKHKPNHSKASLRFPPGPRPLPFIGNLHNIIGSLPHRAMRDLSRQYGPLMLLRLGEKPTVIVSSPHVAREIMKTHDINFASRPISDTSYRSIREEEVGNLINSIFSCASRCEPVNISKRLTSLTSDIITRAIIGNKCKNQDVFLRELELAVKLYSSFSLTDFFPSSWLARLVSGAVREADRSQQVRSQYLDEIIEERRERRIATDESEVKDLLEVLLTLHKNDTLTNQLDMETVKTVILDLFAAGTETSSTTLEWAMSELLRNPTVMKKAQSEVRELLNGGTRVSESHLDKQNYLHLVIKETLRLHPPVPFLIPRQCRQTCQILDYDITEGTTVLVNVWAMGRDPKYWKDPEEFKPERFMNNSTDFKGSDFEYLPFGSGRRMCVGMSFGLANVELPLASLLYHFDWKLPDGLNPEQIDMSESFGITAARKTPLLLYAVLPHEANMGIQG